MTSPAEAEPKEPTPPGRLPEASAKNALAPGLSLENRRYLLYLYSRLNQSRVAEAIARQILEEYPGDKQTLVALVTMYLERKEGDKALRVARTLVKLDPADQEAQGYLGEAYYLTGQYGLANQILSQARAKQPRAKVPSFAAGLASAALRSGDWHQALLAYQEVLSNPALDEPTRREVRTVIEQIYREHLPEATLGTTGVLLRSGLSFRTSADYRQHVTDRDMVFAHFARDNIKVDGTPGLLRRWVDYDEGVAGLDHTLSRNWRASAWAGGADSGVLGGAELTRQFAERATFHLRFDGRARAQEGLLFESLDGRQNRLGLSGSYTFDRPWLAYFEWYGRELLVGDRHLGYSHGGSFNMERILRQDAPEWRVGYRARWMFFSLANDDPSLVAPAVPASLPESEKRRTVRELVLSEFHRQGLYLAYADHLSDFLLYHAAAGLDYAFDRSTVEYNGMAGLSYFPRKSIELRAETTYVSSSTTSDRDTDQWQFDLSLRYWF